MILVAVMSKTSVKRQSPLTFFLSPKDQSSVRPRTNLDGYKQELEKNNVQSQKHFIKSPSLPIVIVTRTIHIKPPRLWDAHGEGALARVPQCKISDLLEFQ